MKTIGIVGFGFVGRAVFEGMKHAFEVRWYDKYLTSILDLNNNESLKDLLGSVTGPIFICVPTPMRKDGSCDTSIVESVVKEINDISQKLIEAGPTKINIPILIIKSTVVPGTTEKFNEKYQYVQCVFNPEFLRESSSVEDFKKQDRIIIGGPQLAVSVVKTMYQKAYPDVPTTKTSSTIAEMVKYITNCFLAVKVSFANEIYQICNKLNVDYDKVIEYATKDARLGQSHWAVPGPMPASDGSGKLLFGYGGSCLIKDLNALMLLAKELCIDPKMLSGSWQKNLEVRPEKDWEQLKGRAVS